MSTDVIDRLNEALEGRYRVERELGEGGMATVYLTQDLRHDRRVAMKVLRPELAAMVGAERFLAEIQTTAKLQHPHILPLFDSGEADGFLFYVMPFVEGESLRQRLDRESQLPVDEAVEMAAKVADALDYAHERGVVHRDVKPGNVLLSERGEPLVADFGIALAVSQAGGGRITETGLSLGTPHYMSPEQASGEPRVDRRADVYALGCVLYEMLAGEPPFDGPTSQAVLARILTSEARSLTEVRKTVPPHVEAVVAKALEKLPADRFASAAPFGEALRDAAFRHVSRSAPGATRATGVGRERQGDLGAAAWTSSDRRVRAAVGLAVILALVAAWGWLRPVQDEAGRRPVRLSLDLGELENDIGDVAISPDGARVALSAVVEGQRAIWVRALAESEFRLVPGTEDGVHPAFSPDGEWIVFRNYPSTTLVKVPVSGGTAVTIVDDPAFDPYVPHWGEDGTIAFGGPEGLGVVSETGAGLRMVLSGVGAFSPQVLPGGETVLASTGMAGEVNVVVVDLDEGGSRVIVPEASHSLYIPTGHLLYVSAGGLFAVPFDARRGQPSGNPSRVLDRVASESEGRMGYDISRLGTLVYREGGPRGSAELERFVILDRDGNADTLRLPPQALGDVKFSPDGRHIAYESGDEPDQIHTFDLTTGRITHLTSEGDNDAPIWSPDGARIIFSSNRAGTEGEDLFAVAAMGGQVPTRLLSLPGAMDPTSWVADDLVTFQRRASEDSWDIWTLSVSGDGDAEPWLEAPCHERGLRISPNGQIAAYNSDETGTDQVYVRTFPEPGRQWQVSSPGAPAWKHRWAPDGESLYFWTRSDAPLDTLYEAAIEWSGSAVRVGPSRAVLAADLTDDFGWDIHPDGEHFLVTVDVTPATTGAEETADEVSDKYIVVLNWFTELRERLGEARD